MSIKQKTKPPQQNGAATLNKATARKIKVAVPKPSQNGHAQFSPTELLRVLTEVKNGNFNVRMPIDESGIEGKICDTLNEIISLNERMMLEFTKAGNTIGKKGKLTERIEAPSVRGAWK